LEIFVKKADFFVWGAPAGSKDFVDLRAAAAEFVASAFFVIVGCGSAVSNGAFDGATRLLVAFGFGIGIMALVRALARAQSEFLFRLSRPLG